MVTVTPAELSAGHGQPGVDYASAVSGCRRRTKFRLVAFVTLKESESTTYASIGSLISLNRGSLLIGIGRAHLEDRGIC
jgi:hypothetical protein